MRRKNFQPAQVIDLLVLKAINKAQIVMQPTIDQVAFDTKSHAGKRSFMSWYHRVMRSVNRLEKAGYVVKSRNMKESPAVYLAIKDWPLPLNVDEAEVMRRIENPPKND